MFLCPSERKKKFTEKVDTLVEKKSFVIMWTFQSFLILVSLHAPSFSPMQLIFNIL